jgi:hypothetical protein
MRLHDMCILMDVISIYSPIECARWFANRSEQVITVGRAIALSLKQLDCDVNGCPTDIK